MTEWSDVLGGKSAGALVESGGGGGRNAGAERRGRAGWGGAGRTVLGLERDDWCEDKYAVVDVFCVGSACGGGVRRRLQTLSTSGLARPWPGTTQRTLPSKDTIHQRHARRVDIKLAAVICSPCTSFPTPRPTFLPRLALVRPPHRPLPPAPAQPAIRPSPSLPLLLRPLATPSAPSAPPPTPADAASHPPVPSRPPPDSPDPTRPTVLAPVPPASQPRPS